MSVLPFQKRIDAAAWNWLDDDELYDPCEILMKYVPKGSTPVVVA